MTLYESLKKYGYNIFDSGDDFYNDICTVYTTPNGTDMIIEDRKKKIYSNNGNTTMCQDGCDFKFYNTTTKKSVCDCEIQKECAEMRAYRLVSPYNTPLHGTSPPIG